MSDSLLNGTAILEEKLNHPYFENRLDGKALQRVRFGRASFFIRMSELEKIDE